MAFSTPASDTSLPTPGGAALALPRGEVRGSSLWRDAWRRLLRNKLAVVGGVVVILLCPGRRRSSSRCITAASNFIPGFTPSITTPTAGP